MSPTGDRRSSAIGRCAMVHNFNVDVFRCLEAILCDRRVDQNGRRCLCERGKPAQAEAVSDPNKCFCFGTFDRSDQTFTDHSVINDVS